MVAETNAPELRNAVLGVQKERDEFSKQSFLLRGKVAQAGDYAEMIFGLEFSRDCDFRNMRRASSLLPHRSPTTEGLQTAFDRIKDFTVPRTKTAADRRGQRHERQSIVDLLGYEDIETVAVATGNEALEAMLGKSFDCVVLDLRLPDMPGFELLEKVHAEPTLADVPVVVFTGKDLYAEEQTQLKAMAKSIVLLEIRMPEMGGYETMREIRNALEFRTLPILALTAKAMKGGREKCLNAGASDYIARPVNTDQLLSLIRVWLFR